MTQPKCSCGEGSQSNYHMPHCNKLRRPTSESHQAQGADWEKEFDQHFGVFGDGIASKDEVKSFIRKAIEQARLNGMREEMTLCKIHTPKQQFEAGQQVAYQEIREMIAGSKMQWPDGYPRVGEFCLADGFNYALRDLDAAVEKLINKTN